jgi:proteasome lid subunit RPN8/RPN11
MIVEIASRVHETLLAQAAIAPDQECCGLLLGTPGRIADVVPARNVAADPARSFEIDPATLLHTHRAARGAGFRIIGHYHSHPNGRAEPSLRDAARAVENGDIWLIIAAHSVTGHSVTGQGVTGHSVNGWRVTASDTGGSAVHGRFLPVTLVTV